MRILWLFGPPGVGKSVTAWEVLALLSRSEPTAYVDIDQLGMAAPEPGDEGERHRQQAWALAAVGRVHAQRGATTLVVSGVLDPDQLGFYRRALADFDLSLVRLAAGDAVLRSRVAARGRYAEDWAGVLPDARRHEAAGHGLPVVRTDRGSPAEVARCVIDVAAPLSTAAFARAGEPGPASAARDGRAVLVTGCRLVGKSTVGWQAFMAASRRGIPTAFVDLRQLGFRGWAGGAVDHELQAAVTGALWRVFRARGNELLVLNGATGGPGNIETYADRLDGTPMTAVRLTAGRDALAARARARVRGEMAPLAGDDMVGAAEEYVRQVLDAACRAQEEWPSADDPCIDTTGLTAAETAAMILDLATP